MRAFLLLVVAAFALSFSSVSAASAGGELSLAASTTLVAVGEPLVVSIRAATGGKPVNAIEGEIAYNPSDFSVEKISIDDSILGTWSTAPSYDSASGVIRFSGWADHTFNGSNGLIASVVLVPLRVGQSGLDFNSGAMLAADGKGSNIITGMKSIALRIQPKESTNQPPEASPQSTTTPPVSSPVAPAEPIPVAPAPIVSNDQNAAALALAGMQLAPILVPFFTVLTLIAFVVAYALHRIGR